MRYLAASSPTVESGARRRVVFQECSRDVREKFHAWKIGAHQTRKGLYDSTSSDLRGSRGPVPGIAGEIVTDNFDS